MSVWGRMWAAGYDFLGGRMQPIERPYRERIVADARGEVLEIGAGTGFNFPHYRAATHVVAIEPDAAMRRRAERRAPSARVAIEVRRGDAHSLDFPDASFDVVIFCLVLCTIPDPARALAEARRVLRPDGELHFYEHVRAKEPALARRQDRWLRPWRGFNRGCHPNRDTVRAIEGSGFAVKELERFELDEKGVPKIVRPHAIGVAVKS